MVLFRKKVVALSRRILENGTMDERRVHIVNIITEFLESDMFRKGLPAQSESPKGVEKVEPVDRLDEFLWDLPPISEREFDKFTRIQLRRLDNAKYFKRHIG